VLHTIPLGRTVSLSAFALHCQRKLEAFGAGRRLYGSMRARNARLRVHGLRAQQMHRLAQTLAWGATTVAGRWQRSCGRRGPDRAARGLRPQISVIAWGAASIGVGSAISRGGIGPSRAFERFVRAHYGPLGVFFVRVDEYCTSKVCTSCWQRTHKGLRIGGRPPSHKLQVCEDHTHPLVVDRDVSASIAIMVAFLNRLFAGGAPAWQARRRRRQDDAPPPP
jgi:hypothetical protein